jgi:hypothetical protein
MLDQRGELIGDARNNTPHRLGSQNQQERLGTRKAHRIGRIHLSPIDGLNSTANDFSLIAGRVQTQRHDSRPESRQVDPEYRQAEVDPQDLNQERTASKELDVAPAERGERSDARNAEQAEYRAEHQPQENRQHRDLDRDDRALE